MSDSWWWSEYHAVSGRGCAEKQRKQYAQSLPGKSGRPLSISAMMHPTLQTSIARVYSLKVSMTSGARYHLRMTVSCAGCAREEYYSPSRDVFCHECARIIGIGRWACGAGETKVAHLLIEWEISARTDKGYGP